MTNNQNDLYKALIEKLNFPIILLKDEKIVFVNKSVTKLLKFEKEDLLNLELTNLLTEKNYKIFKKVVEKIRDKKKVEKTIVLKIQNSDDINIKAKISSFLFNNEKHIKLELIDENEIIQAQNKLEYRIQHEKLISDISQSFVNINTLDFDKNLERAFSKICELTQLSSIYIFYFNTTDLSVEKTYFWNKNVTDEIRQAINSLNKETIPWIINKTFVERKLIKISNVDDLPPHAVGARYFMKNFNINSFITIPLEKSDKPIGLIGFNSKEPLKKWPKEEVITLKVTAQIFNNAYLHNEEKKKLAENEQKFRMLFESANDAIFLMSNDVFIDCNEKTLEMFECKRDEIIGFQPYLFSPEKQPDERDSKEKAMEKIKLALNGKKETFEWVHQTRKGRNFFAEVSLNSIIQNKELIIQAIVRDISERKTAENKIKESEEKFKAVFHEAFQFIGILDSNGILKEANESSLRLYNIEKNDIIGKYFWDTPWWTHSLEEQNKLKMAFRKAKKGEFVRFETNHINQNNKKIYVDFSLKPIKNEEGKIVLFIPEGRDISEIKEMEEAVFESEKKFREIYNSSNDSILITTLGGEVIEANAAFYKISGYEVDEIKGKNMINFVKEEYIPLFSKISQADRTNKAKSTIEFEFIKKNRELITVEINSKVIEISNQKYILSIARDISERKQQERNIYSAVLNAEEKERERLAGDLHDEIGPVLSSMKMYLNYMDDLDDKNKRYTIVNELKELADEAIKSIREISNALSPHILSNHGLNAAIKIIIEQNKKFFKINFSQNIFSKRFENKVETVYYRIIKELINNTIRHANANEISINISYENETLTLSYKDDGKGFDYSEKLTKAREGLGLFNILNRIKTIKGNFIIDTKKGKGFSLVLKTNQVKEIV